MPRRFRWLLVVVVLVVPIARGARIAVRAERNAAAASRYLSRYTMPPPLGGQPDPLLLAGIVARVPAHASVSVVNRNLAVAAMRWLAYAIAPRQLTTVPTRWTIVFGETPAEAGIHPAHAWPYGSDWLVER